MLAILCITPPAHPSPSSTDPKMSTLHVYLLSGFAGDTVQLELDEREAWTYTVGHGADLLLGYEARVDLETGAGGAVLTVRLLNRQLTERIRIEDAPAFPYLFLKLEQERLIHELDRSLGGRGFG